MPSEIVIVKTIAPEGLDGVLCTVETHIQRGLPRFNVVGLPEASVREAKERVRAAIINSGFSFPMGRITINLSPADIRKDGSHYDLAIALGILVHTGQVRWNEELQDMAVMGELGLCGRVKTVFAAFSHAICLRHSYDVKRFLLSQDDAKVVQQIEGICVLGLQTLRDLQKALGKPVMPGPDLPVASCLEPQQVSPLCKIPQAALRALELSAAGNHALLLSGPPGSGKTTLARQTPALLPDLSYAEQIELTRIYSASGLLNVNSLVDRRPFRTPHTTITTCAMTGGGSQAKPGEVTLAHLGVLFLDEFTDFNPRVIDSLRQPIVEGHISVQRMRRQYQWPASFQLVAAMNPCPCGYYGDLDRPCRCSLQVLERYQQRISGPIMDRFDLRLWLSTSQNDAARPVTACDWKHLRRRVANARQRQLLRNRKLNAFLGNDPREYLPLTAAAKKSLDSHISKGKLSYRNIAQRLRVAQTIADLSEQDEISCDAILEAGFHQSLPGGLK